jgi:hypothetical protein
MIGQTIFRKNLASQSRFGALTQANNRGFAGGGNKPKAIDPKTTDYDIVFVGKFPRSPLPKVHDNLCSVQLWSDYCVQVVLMRLPSPSSLSSTT